jgi:hypothetical protein
MRLVTILGMHRSGTSAFSGVARELGLSFGWLRKPGDLDEGGRDYKNAFNARGNHENRELRWLHDEILERSGGSWFQPPDAIEISGSDRERRDEVLGSFSDDTVAIKDPRLLLVMDLYRELEPLPIAVIRNPASVAESLDRRSEKQPPAQKQGRQKERPTASLPEWEALWRHYNSILLREIERTPMPVVDFDRGDLAAQARAALEFHGIEASGSSDFFDPAAATDPGDWRDRVSARESLELWDELENHAIAVR